MIEKTKDKDGTVVYSCRKCGYGTYDEHAAKQHEADPI